MKIDPDLFKKPMNDPHLACAIYAIEMLRQIDSAALARAGKDIYITLTVNGVEIPFFDFIDRVNANVTNRAQSIAEDTLRNELYAIQRFLNDLQDHINAYTNTNGYP